MLHTIYEDLKRIAGADRVRRDEPMDTHTTFRAGGKAAYYVEAADKDILSGIIEAVRHKMPYFLLGNGSNVLVKDSGYDGVVIRLTGSFTDISVHEDGGQCEVCAGAAAALSRAARQAADMGYAGMETLAGIPGTVGGAVAMNAGAYGGEIKDIIVSADIMDRDGRVMRLMGDELDLSYRHSIVQDEGYIVLSAVFRLEKDDIADINGRMNKYAGLRAQKQPLEYPSAGSTFKRPEGYFAGKLIMDAGLRGHSVGGAMVSEKHCGFVINKGNASAADILKVIEEVRAEVKKQFGVELEPEIKILG